MTAPRPASVRPSLAERWVSVVQTLLRMFPFPVPTGLRRIGHPGRDSPVLLTGNFGLTVQRVRQALAGLDAWLLVANSRGVNVWCAATGGLLTDHDVVSVIKTSGIDGMVDHRRVILPQLAATGIDGQAVRRRCGWQVVWGPVEAAAIPAFLRSPPDRPRDPARPETRALRTVAFPLGRRLEMALAWAFPLSVLVAAVLLPWRRAAILPALALVWCAALALYSAFPLYEPWLRPSARRTVFGVTLDAGQFVLVLACWALTMAGWLGLAALRGRFPPAHALPWAAGALLLLALLGLDLSGTTPVHKSGLLADRLLSITLNAEACTGAAFCAQVCPKDVLEIDHERHLAVLARPDACIQCGACVVQCPFDALFFREPGGAVVPPQAVREFKLNMLGTRTQRRP